MPKRRIGGQVRYVRRLSRFSRFRPNPNQQNQQDGTGGNATPPKKAGSIEAFSKMSDDDKAAAVLSAKNVRLPDGLPNTLYQKLAFQQGLDHPPTAVDDNALDKMRGTDYYRGVSANSKDKADNIVANVMLEENTFFSDTGGSVVGRGIYISNELWRAQRYASHDTDGAVMRFKLKDGTKVIKLSSAENLLSREIASGSKFGKALSGIDRHDAVSIVAAAKGYHVIDLDWRTNLLTRDAVTMSYSFASGKNLSHRTSDWKKLIS